MSGFPRCRNGLRDFDDCENQPSRRGRQPDVCARGPGYEAETQHLTKEHNMNYVPLTFREDNMFRAVVEEAAALTSIVLFLGMIAVWAEVLGTL
jgi:hypothetical protein